jgi:hypothetical protein
MDKLIIYEEKENGIEYLKVHCELDDINSSPTFIRNTLEYIKNHNKYVKVSCADFENSEIEYFEHSVRHNKNGAAFIDKNGKKYFYLKGKEETKNSEQLLNNDRSNILKDILNDIR